MDVIFGKDEADRIPANLPSESVTVEVEKAETSPQETYGHGQK